MELKQYLGILWRWAWLIILGAILGAGGAYLYSIFTTPVYSAASTVRINQSPSDRATDISSLDLNQRLAQTYVQLLTKRPVMEEVIKELNLSISPIALTNSVKVNAVTGTELIVVQVESTDPVLAAKLANLIPEVFGQQNDSFQSSRYSVAKSSLVTELNNLSDQIRAKQTAVLGFGNPTNFVNQTEMSTLLADLSQLRQSYNSALESYQNVLLAEAQSTSNIQIVEPALVPNSPVRPKPLQNSALAGALGLLAGFGIALLVEYLDDSLRSPEQVSKLLGAPVMGVVAQISGIGKNAQSRDGSLLAVEQPRSPIVEAFRTLRTNIQFAGVDLPVRSLLITSASPTEGKSTISSNLAVVMAQAGLRVVLVDGDLRRPSIHKIFGLTNRFGISDSMLQASTQWDNVAQPTEITNLSIISTGSLPPNPSELLGSQRFRQFLEKLTSTYDMVIVDSPPLLPVTDAAIISRAVDSVLLVIDTGATRAGAVAQSKERLNRVGARVLGVVMNKFTLGRSGYYSQYYQYYSQYYYYGDGSNGKRNGKNGNGNGNGKGHSSNGNGSKPPILKQPASEAPTGSKLN